MFQDFKVYSGTRCIGMEGLFVAVIVGLRTAMYFIEWRGDRGGGLNDSQNAPFSKSHNKAILHVTKWGFESHVLTTF